MILSSAETTVRLSSSDNTLQVFFKTDNTVDSFFISQLWLPFPEDNSLF